MRYRSILLLISCWLVSCGVITSPPPTLPPIPSPMPTSAPVPSPTPQPTAPPTATTTARAATPVPPILTPVPPSPTPLTANIIGPLLVDSAGGRLYTTGQVGDKSQVVVLSASDVRVLAAYDITGTLGLDSTHGWLYVDRGEPGLAVLNARTGAIVNTIPLPRNRTPWQRNPAPLADPAASQVFAFRDHTVQVVDPQKGEVIRTIPFEVSKQPDCRDNSANPLSIEGAVHDATRRILYLDFVTYVCTPWFGSSIVSYDVTAGKEITRSGGTLRDASGAIAADGYLYGTDWYRMGISYRWTWKDGRLWFYSSDWSWASSGFQLDANRRRLYQGSAARLSIFDAQTMALAAVVSLPIEGDLRGYDPGTDHLYFLSNGRLRAWSAATIPSPSAASLGVSEPLTLSVRSLIVSPAWSQDRTLFGVWSDRLLAGPCWVFGVYGGPLLISHDEGRAWGQPRGGLPKDCNTVSALAVSPNYASDRTIFAGIMGFGLFKTTDGGRLWQPASAGLPSMGVNQVLVSPGFARDQTVFVHVKSGDLYRSQDGGRTWRFVNTRMGQVTMSPEFDQDHTLLGVAYQDSRPELRVSRDAGERWERVGALPGDEGPALISPAPLFARWRVVFAYGGDGSLYRSEDGGANWRHVLTAGKVSAGALTPPQIVYAPNRETNRPVFLVTTVRDESSDPPTDRGLLFRSGDGGLNWKRVALPDTLSPRAIAISPNFNQDGLLFVGAADGRVVSLVQN